MDVILRAHPVHGESHIQRNANGEVAKVLLSVLGQFAIFIFCKNVMILCYILSNFVLSMNNNCFAVGCAFVRKKTEQYRQSLLELKAS